MKFIKSVKGCTRVDGIRNQEIRIRRKERVERSSDERLPKQEEEDNAK